MTRGSSRRRRHRGVLGGVAVGLWLLTGCTGDEPAAVSTEPDTVRPRFEMEWGTLNGDPELALAGVGSFVVDDRGRLYVYEGDRGIRIFSPQGELVRVLASEGQGPDEVEYVPVMTWGHGLLVAWDMGNRRVTMWNDRLERIRTLPAPRYWTAYEESALTVAEGGEVWVKLAPDWESDGRGFPRPEYLRLWPPSEDTLFVGPGGPACDVPYDYDFRNGFWADMRAPWFPTTVTALDGDGAVYVGCNDAFTFHRIEGADTTRFSRPDRSLRIPDDERSFFEGAWTPSMGTLPPHRPEYSRLIPTGDGRVWAFETSPAQPVEVSEAVRTMSGFGEVLGVAERGGRFSVFDEEGRLVAVVPLPDDVRYSGFATTPRVWVRGDTLWALRTGEFDEEYVARYTVPIGAR